MSTSDNLVQAPDIGHKTRRSKKKGGRQTTSSFSPLKGTVSGLWLVDSQCGARRRKIRDDVLCRIGGFIPRKVGVVSYIEIALAGRSNDRCARRIVGFVKRHPPRHNLNENGTGVGMPSTLAPGFEDDALHGEVERGLGFDLDVPVPRHPLDLEVLVVGIAESGAAEWSRRRSGAHREVRIDARRVMGSGNRRVRVALAGDQKNGGRVSRDATAVESVH